MRTPRCRRKRWQPWDQYWLEMKRRGSDEGKDVVPVDGGAGPVPVDDGDLPIELKAEEDAC